MGFRLGRDEVKVGTLACYTELRPRAFVQATAIAEKPRVATADCHFVDREYREGEENLK